MKIYSHNIWDRNTKLDQALEFIQELDFDVLCLQEVPEEFLVKLQILPYTCTAHVDTHRILPHGILKNYLVILTRDSVVETGRFVISQGLVQPLRMRLLIRCMKMFGWTRIDTIGGMYVDIRMQEANNIVRIFCVHFRLDSPSERRKEFQILSEHLISPGENIICGDLNIIDSPYVKPLNWLLGASVQESLPWYSERTLIEKTFSRYGLTNPLYRRKTHTVFQNQLDHILVPSHLKVCTAEVLSDSLGSDHYPISVHLELK